MLCCTLSVVCCFVSGFDFCAINVLSLFRHVSCFHNETLSCARYMCVPDAVCVCSFENSNFIKTSWSRGVYLSQLANSPGGTPTLQTITSLKSPWWITREGQVGVEMSSVRPMDPSPHLSFLRTPSFTRCVCVCVCVCVQLPSRGKICI